MNYTKPELDAMTDSEIELAVAKMVYTFEPLDGSEVMVVRGVNGSNQWLWLDECGIHPAWEACGIPFFRPTRKWEHIMPLAYKYEIFPTKALNDGVLVHAHLEHFSAHKNPKRALCEVLLMIGVKNGE